MSLYIHHHLGLGDHFVCNGLVRHILESKKKEVILAVKKPCYETVRALYTDSALTLDPVVNDSEAENNGSSKNYLKIGFNFTWARLSSWEKSFYEQLDIPYDYRLTKAHTPRNKLREKSLYDEVVPREPYAFCNISCSKGTTQVNMNTKLPKVFLSKKTPNLLDWLMVIENAQEIHTIDTSVFQLIKNLNLPQSKFFYRAADLGGKHLPVEFDGQEWIVK